MGWRTKKRKSWGQPRGADGSRPGHGVALCSVLLFPALFTLGMPLLDATDGILLLGRLEIGV